ncbi:M13 family metallopeptidase [Hymenobacter sp. BT770]|uniref:M13 family metallopeptidase n=1 Tax=Hymenobacter sp. BT770 TaxID=2886942 RepID=UPI001D104D06|nr:M13 family metallopeptidase [Hymenobacter sp. BT770]MCC3155203.1 M13 family metallopeptidase [Hymenobacter sp. BT770]MDO3417158.1 M13 family metallopeptidase [Hymenobacter sp. BT770]
MTGTLTHYALAAGLLALTATSPALAQSKVKTSAGKQKVATSPTGGSGLSRADLDTSVPPCENFYQYANGGWLKKNPIPAAETSWGTGAELAQRNRALVHRILDNAAANHSAHPGSNLQKVGDFYGSAMDTAAIEAAGLQYLQPHLARIAAVQDLAGMQRLLADPKTHVGNSWYGYGVGPDAKQSDVYAVYAEQNGLTLPDRDYYLKDDPRSKAIRAAYQAYLVNTFKLLGDSPATAAQNAATVQRLETRLAQASRTAVALRDPQKNYNKLTVAQAHQDYPNLNLPLVLQQNGLGAAQTIVVGQPEFFKEVNAMLGTEPLADQKTYLRWHLVTRATPALPQAFGAEAFRFAQTLTGARQQEPRWRRSLAATDASLGEAFGQLYVDEAFSPAAKVRAKQLVENLRQAYAERIRATDWMSPETKAQALKKLTAIAVKIGYPDQWKDYSTLNISRESYLNNLFAASEFSDKDNYRHFGKPIDRTEWGMTPPTVNAYYNPLYNEIVFPAGILQPPFFDPRADDAVNYGATAVVIGHEITHGFDDQGRQYDAQGNLHDWWTKEDNEKFNAKAAVVGKQYDAFTPLDSVHINGKLTMGENLADIGGLTIAYQAFQKTQQAKEGKLIDGFTPNQRFFLAFALRFRRNQRAEDIRKQIQTDPHSPSQYRVLGALMNMPEFYEAFGCKDGNKMVRSAADRSRIW